MDIECLRWLILSYSELFKHISCVTFIYFGVHFDMIIVLLMMKIGLYFL